MLGDRLRATLHALKPVVPQRLRRAPHGEAELGRLWQRPLQYRRDSSRVVGRSIDLFVDYEELFKIYSNCWAHSIRLG